MRILSVTHFYENHGGGIERVAGNLCRQFAAAGHLAVWAASADDAAPDPSTANAVPLACLNLVERVTGLPMPLPTPAALLRLRRAVRAVDAVVVHDALYVTSIAALLFARAAGKPVALVQHIADIPLKGRVLPRVIALANRWVTRPMLAAADHVVFISATTRDAFADVRTRRPPLLAFNGVDAAVFHPGSDAPVDTPAPPRRLLFVGRFVEKKGLAVIEALARRRPDLHVTLAGHGSIDPARWALPNTTVVRGASGATLADLYRAADRLILPSVGEGYPLVVQEAMACGLPVVCGEDTARADPGAATWLRGVAVDLNDPAGTAARIEAVLGEPAPPAATRAAMAVYAARTYSWPAIASTIAGCFERAGQLL